jgi:pimeloyl-ACP methyl ester carboxylesterase
MGVIRKRHVFYVEGYDPQGAAGYYALFRREFERFRNLWPLRGSLTALQADAGTHAARWNIEAAAPNWQVAVAYEFLNWDDIIARDLKRSMPWRLGRALVWIIDDLRTGTVARIFRASWRFGLLYIYQLVVLLLWLELALAAGWASARVAGAQLATPTGIAALIGIAVAFLVFVLLRPLAERILAIQLADLWFFFRDLTFGRRKDFEARIDRFAERLVAAVSAADADEIVVVGHSGGAVVASLALARALALDPQLGQRGPKLVLLTLGSIMPAVAMHPRAGGLREALRGLALEHDLVWIDCQASTDFVNFFRFDPIAGVGIDAEPAAHNPIVLPIRFRDLLSPEIYRRFRWNVFRMHFQFIMANDRRATYDYFLYLCGPIPLETWARDPAQALASFGADASTAHQ